MATRTVDFPTWFNAGCYGGLACCLLAIAFVTLYTLLRHRGTTRQLVRAIAVCLFAGLLLLPAILWFHVRFMSHPHTLSSLEITAMLCYVMVSGWLLPLVLVIGYFLFTLPQPVNTVASHASPGYAGIQTPETLHPPRYQPGVQAPFVFGDDTPWGWLEYRSGNFQGQRLALKRTVATLGRDEECDIWLDDEMASRFHAELAWYQGQIYLTDCGSMNGVLLNGRRVHGTAPVSSQQLLEVASQRFLFILAEPKEALNDQYDPLSNHKWRSTADLQHEQPDTSTAMPAARMLTTDAVDTLGGGPHTDPAPISQVPLRHMPPAVPAQAPDPITPPPFTRPLGGPMPLKLPSRQKD